MSPKDFRNVFLNSYPVIREKIKTLPFSKDLTGIFDNLTGQSVFLDYVHMTGCGNEQVVKIMSNGLNNKNKK